MKQAEGQTSLLPMLDEWAEEPLRYAVRMEMHKGAHLRIFAALTFPYFQQYAERWMFCEYTGGECAGRCSYGLDVSYSAGGVKYGFLREERIRFSWRQMTEKAREMIWEEGWLTHAEERVVGELMAKYGVLPYPCAASEYPKYAWHGAKPWFRGICKRCGTLDRTGHGECLRCGGKVVKLSPEEMKAVNGAECDADGQGLL